MAAKKQPIRDAIRRRIIGEVAKENGYAEKDVADTVKKAEAEFPSFWDLLIKGGIAALKEFIRALLEGLNVQKAAPTTQPITEETQPA